jgi:predicted outer membrane repeat protein
MDASVGVDSGPTPADAGATLADAGSIDVDAGLILDGGGDSIFYTIKVNVRGYRSVNSINLYVLVDTVFTSSLNLFSDGTFEFDSPVAAGSFYDVQIAFSPNFPGQTCSTSGVLDPASGTLTGDVTVDVFCNDTSYGLELDVQGARTGIFKVSDGLGNEIDVLDTVQGVVALSTANDGSVYDVQVTSQPDSEWCWSLNGRGQIRGAKVTDIKIRCGPVIAVDNSVDAPDANVGDGQCVSSAGGCTLRAAIQNASRFNVPVAILMESGNFFFSLNPADASPIAEGSGDLDVFSGALFAPQINLVGSGRGLTVIDAAQIDRIFDLHEGSFRVDQVTLQKGSVAGRGGTLRAMGGAHLELHDLDMVGGMAGGADGLGGGVHLDSTSTGLFSRVRFETNEATTRGGAISTLGPIGVFDSLFLGNIAPTGGGVDLGNAMNAPLAFFMNTTFTDNIATDTGAAIQIRSGDAELFHTTVAFNLSTNGNAIHLFDGESLLLANSVVARNTSTTNSPDCDGTGSLVLQSWGHNFLGSGDGCAEWLPLSDDFPLPGAFQDPLLVLTVGSGLNHFQEPSASSALVDTAFIAICPPHDQRGAFRPHLSGACDVGAIER